MRKVSPFRFFSGLSFCLLALIMAGIRFSLPNQPVWVAYLGAINCVAFLLVLLDKSTSKSALFIKNRIPEDIFYLLAVCAGSIGLMIAMYLARHKTQKPKFQLIVGGVLIMQVVVASLILRQ